MLDVLSFAVFKPKYRRHRCALQGHYARALPDPKGPTRRSISLNRDNLHLTVSPTGVYIKADSERPDRRKPVRRSS